MAQTKKLHPWLEEAIGASASRQADWDPRT
jgi:hypothetical protein